MALNMVAPPRIRVAQPRWATLGEFLFCQRNAGPRGELDLEADEKAVQRVLVKLVGTAEQIVEQRILPLDVADEQSPSELVLSLK
jgi:hypothetical protein